MKTLKFLTLITVALLVVLLGRHFVFYARPNPVPFQTELEAEKYHLSALDLAVSHLITEEILVQHNGSHNLFEFLRETNLENPVRRFVIDTYGFEFNSEFVNSQGVPYGVELCGGEDSSRPPIIRIFSDTDIGRLFSNE